MSTCRGCGRSIHWITTARGKKIPLDPEYRSVTRAATSTERVTVVTDDGRVVTGNVVSESDAKLLNGVVRGRVSHFATCPKAREFRRADGAES